MIADTTFLIQYLREGLEETRGPAREFLAHNRGELIRTSVISIGEVAVAFPTSAGVWEYFKKWRIYPLHRGIVEAAADIDRALISAGQWLGENDNWIAGFCRYYREPLLSLDQAFDRVPGLRRMAY